MRRQISITMHLATLLFATAIAAQTVAVPTLTREQADEQYPRYKVELFEQTSPADGPHSAPVTLVAVQDFQCPFCGRASKTVAALKERYRDDLRVVFHNNPLGFHQRARPAAEAALAANLQSRFWDYAAMLFDNARKLEDKDLQRYARKLGLRMSLFNKDRRSGRFDKQIKAEVDQATRLGARGTPSFFINGRYMAGAQPQDKFEAVIDLELDEARKLLDQGVSSADLYDRLTRDGLTQARPREPRPSTPSRPREDPNKIHDVPVGDSPTLGPPDAPVKVVVFTDYQCPYCKRLEPTLLEIRKQYGSRVEIAWKHLPLPFHKRALPAARAAVAAQRQGRFFELHAKLFDNSRALEDADLERYAREVGLDMGGFEQDFNSGSVDAVVESDQGLAGRIGAKGTPTSFINGRKLSGAQPFDKFREIIDAELQKRGIPH